MQLALNSHTITTAIGLLKELPLDVYSDDKGVFRFDEGNTIRYLLRFDRYSLSLDVLLNKSDLTTVERLDNAIQLNQENLSTKASIFRETILTVGKAMAKHRRTIVHEAFQYLRPIAISNTGNYPKCLERRDKEDAPRFERLERIQQWLINRKSKETYRNAHLYPNCSSYFLFLLREYAPFIDCKKQGITRDNVCSFHQAHEW